MHLSRLRFALPLNFDRRILLLLFIGHMPNRYIGAALFILVFLTIAARNRHIYFLPETRKYYLLLLSAYMLCFISFFFHYSHINNILWGLFNASPILLIPFIIPRQSLKMPFLNSLKIFVVFEALFFIGQYINVAIENKQFNIFHENQGAGDSLTGSFLGITGAPITVSLCFCIIIFLNELLINKNKSALPFLILCSILSFLPGNMATIFCFFVSLICYLFLSFFLQIMMGKIQKGILLASSLGILFFSIGWAIESENINYGFKLLGLLIRENPPIKVKAVYSTFDMLKENNDALFMGVGLGNFSSRAAYMVSGEYLLHQPVFIPSTPSKYTKHYLLSIWNRGTWNMYNGGAVGDSMINRPFNQYLAFLGEGGIAALVALLLIYLFILIKGLQRPQLPFLILVSIFSLLIFSTDLWIDYPSFALMFWIGMKYSNYYPLKINYRIPLKIHQNT